MPKILWMSPYSLHDFTSGAAVHCRNILESLHSSGFEVWAISSLIFTNPQGSSFLINELKEPLANNPQSLVFHIIDKGVNYFYVRSSQYTESLRTTIDQQNFYEYFCQILDSYNPDIVMGFGTSMDTLNCFAQAKRKGISTTYMLFNSTDTNFAFPHIDLILTDSKATRDLYAQREHIYANPIRQFIQPQYIVAPKRAPKFVTIINPSLEKGLAIFATIAKASQTRFPDLKFLVVNTADNFTEQLHLLHSKDNVDEHPFTAADFPNVLITGSAYDMRLIYAQTRILLVPSLTFQTWSRPVSEAIFNDIPVLGHNIGGINEAIGEAGIVLDPIKHCLEDYSSIPNAEEIEPYLQALEKLLTNDYSEAINIQKRNLDLTLLTEHLIGKLQPLFVNSQRYFAH